jgi:hypothetical protein
VRGLSAALRYAQETEALGARVEGAKKRRGAPAGGAPSCGSVVCRLVWACSAIRVGAFSRRRWWRR